MAEPVPPDPLQTPVLIIGSGSAGLAAGTWLSRYGVPFVILERRPGPMTRGQADGVQCRTVEMFESFGLDGELLAESYHVLEVAFWATAADAGPEGTTALRRTRTTVDTEPGLSHQPHVILNQARMNELLIGAIRKGSLRDGDGAGNSKGVIKYGYSVKSVVVDEERAYDQDAYCVEVVAEEHGIERRFKARYVLGCDGAHSVTRKSLGFKMVGDSSDAVWGVMDVYPRTNFPDIRRKSTLHTKAGNLLIIPREGGSLVRFYIELPAGSVAKDVKLSDLQDQARRIFSPYEMEIADTIWWSAYSIGQRQADFFTKSHRVFLTGDACHTHSPKAGQGMNVSLQDGYNIGWKLGAVLKGEASPRLLETYVLERERVATDLIEFDRHISRIFSSTSNGVTPEYFSEQFIKSGRYMAGLTARYDDSMITDSKGSDMALANKLVVGMRMPSRQVVRLCDAKAMQLIKAFPADGRWRILIFAGSIQENLKTKRLSQFAKIFSEFVGRHYPCRKGDLDEFIEPIIVFSGKREEIEFEMIPAYYWPATGKYKMRDLHKVFVDEESYHHGHGRAYQGYGIDESKPPVVIIVRPDQYISKICALDMHDAIVGFFAEMRRL